MSSNNTETAVKALGVTAGVMVFGVNGPFLFERFGWYLPLAVATGVMLGAAIGYEVAALLFRASHRERAAAAAPAVRQKAHPRAA